MILNMLNKLVKLSSFEVKKNLFHNIDWISSGLFLLINITIFPFTVNPNPEVLNQLFISVIMTSILLCLVLTAHHIFDEDVNDGSFNQYLVFGIPIHIIYLSKVIAVSIEFALIITIIFPFSVIFYAISFHIII